MRVLLDANILISYLLTTRPTSPVRTVVRAAIAGDFTLLLPAALLAEVRQAVATSDFLANRLTPADIDVLADLLNDVADVVPAITAPLPRLTRDPKDDYLLAYAVVGQADFLVTGDVDLLSLGTVEGVTIIRPADFSGLINDQEL